MALSEPFDCFSYHAHVSHTIQHVFKTNLIFGIESTFSALKGVESTDVSRKFLLCQLGDQYISQLLSQPAIQSVSQSVSISASTAQRRFNEIVSNRRRI